MRQLTDDLLTIAKADSNTIEIELVDQPFEKAFEPQLSSYQDIAVSHRSPSQRELPKAGRALFDTARMKQLLVILLDNAFKYTQAGDYYLG